MVVMAWLEMKDKKAMESKVETGVDTAPQIETGINEDAGWTALALPLWTRRAHMAMLVVGTYAVGEN